MGSRSRHGKGACEEDMFRPIVMYLRMVNVPAQYMWRTNAFVAVGEDNTVMWLVANYFSHLIHISAVWEAFPSPTADVIRESVI